MSRSFLHRAPVAAPDRADPAASAVAKSDGRAARVGRDHERVVRTLCCVLLCAASIQDGASKALDFSGAQLEMAHLGLSPTDVFATSVIALELGASAAIVLGIGRAIAACALAAIALAAFLFANRVLCLSGGRSLFSTSGFLEHLGLAGAFVLVAWDDRRTRVGIKARPD